MLLGVRTAAWSKSLPYDAEVEYLSRYNNTAYIDLDYRLTNESEMYVKAMFVSNSCPLMGAFDEASVSGAAVMEFTQAWICSDIGLRENLEYITYRATTSNDASFNTLIEMFVNKTTRLIKEGGNVVAQNNVAYTGSFACKNSAYLFAINGRDITNSTVRVYGAYIKNEGEYVRDLIPVRVGTVGYMYDRVSRKLFGNAGTGAFIVGPDI